MEQLTETEGAKEHEAFLKSSKTQEQKIQIFKPVGQASFNASSQLISNIIMPNNTSNTDNFNVMTREKLKIYLREMQNQLYQKSRWLKRLMKENQWKQFQSYKEGLQKIKIQKHRIEQEFRSKFSQLQGLVQKFQKQDQNVDDPLQKIQKVYQNKQLSNAQDLSKQQKINRANLILGEQKITYFPQVIKFQQKNVLTQKSKKKKQQLQQTRSQKESPKDAKQTFLAKELSKIKAQQKINQITPQNLKGFKILSQFYSKLIQKIAQIKKTIFQNIPEILFEMVIYLVSNLYKIVKSLLQSILQQQLHISSGFKDLLRQKIEDQVSQIEPNENAIIKNRISSMEAIIKEKQKIKQNLNSHSNSENKIFLENIRRSFQDFKLQVFHKQNYKQSQQNSLALACASIKELFLQLQKIKQKGIFCFGIKNQYNMEISYRLEQQKQKSQKELQKEFLKQFFGISQINFCFLLFFLLLNLKPQGLQNIKKIQRVCDNLISLEFFQAQSSSQESIKKLAKTERQFQSLIQESIEDKNELRIFYQQSPSQAKLKQLRATLLKQLNFEKNLPSNIFSKILSHEKNEKQQKQQRWKKIQLKYQKVRSQIIEQQKITQERQDRQDEEQFFNFEQSLKKEQSKKGQLKNILQ